MSSPEPATENAFDRISRLTGRLVAWLTLAMVLLTGVIVVLRYAFDANRIWMQETVLWMHAATFTLGAAYTLFHEDHVRVDIFYRKLSDRGRAIVDVGGTLLFLLPVCGWLAWVGWDFAAASWSIHESSREPGGLPYPAIPLLKSCVVVMPVLLALQGISILLRSIPALRGSR